MVAVLGNQATADQPSQHVVVIDVDSRGKQLETAGNSWKQLETSCFASSGISMNILFSRCSIMYYHVLLSINVLSTGPAGHSRSEGGR